MPATITSPAELDGRPVLATAAAPYLEAVQRYARRDAARFHVPAHKGGAGAGGQLVGALGDALQLDVPSCIEGIDLGCGETPLQAAERCAAATWGARRTWFLVNGASEASHAICLALGRSGGEVVVQRNVHASTIHGLVLGGLQPTFVMPGVDEDLGIAHCVHPDDLAEALDQTPGAAAAIVVSPTYFGATADVRGLARVCHDRGVALVVDEAWGAHLRFADQLPQDALAAGADVVISGTHKLIGSLAQSAMLHLGPRSCPQLDEAAISRALALVRTTSPSSLLLASLDAARAHVDVNGEALLDSALEQMQEVKRRLRDVLGLSVLGDELVGSHGVAGFDHLRLAIDVGPSGLDGHIVAGDLLRIADINLELVTSRILIAHVGIGEPVLASGERLIRALQVTLGASGTYSADDAPTAQRACYGEAVMSPRDAFFAEHEAVSLADAAGRVSADSIAVYPPGIANLLPGERITTALVQYLLEMDLRGYPLRGTWDAAARSIRVLLRP